MEDPKLLLHNNGDAKPGTFVYALHEESRFDDHAAMVEELMSIYETRANLVIPGG